MKTKILLAVVLLLSVSDVYSQLEVNADGSVQLKIGGYLSGFTGNSTVYSNTSFGYKTLQNTSTGASNVAVGVGALFANTSGLANTAQGYDALHCNSTGRFNTATGEVALYSNTSGEENTANGRYALYNNTTGAANAAYGVWALYGNTIGSGNTAIGAYTDLTTGTLSNTTAIGCGTIVTASNQVRIGNSNVTSIGGYAAWSNFSDGRAKKNIRANVPGLSFIKRLQPVTYNLDLDAIDELLKIDKTGNSKDKQAKPLSQELINIRNKAREVRQKQVQTGFVAQDVEKTAQSLGYEFSGVDVDESGAGT
jgi:hypothetical protein